MIGFGDVAYNVKEGDGSVSISFGVLSGTLGGIATFRVTTVNGTAVGTNCSFIV